jgi:hypothetical protein
VGKHLRLGKKFINFSKSNQLKYFRKEEKTKETLKQKELRDMARTNPSPNL